MIARFLTLSVLLAAIVVAQSADITGWSDVRWGTSKPVALKTLQPLGARECNRTSSASCPEASRADTLLLEKYNFNNVPFTVNLLFTEKAGLSKAIMTAQDKQGAFEKILSTLTARYGKPGLQSEYDGDAEQIHTSWIWAKPSGKISLESEEIGGIFTVTYEPRR